MMTPTDLPEVTEEEAAKFMLHHLSVAAVYFECTGTYQKTLKLIGPKISDLHRPAFTAFLETINRSYEELK